jgi:hypothetical protein
VKMPNVMIETVTEALANEARGYRAARQQSIATAITTATLQSDMQFQDEMNASPPKSFFARQAELASPRNRSDARTATHPAPSSSQGKGGAAEKGMEIFQNYRVKERSLMERALAHQAVANLQFQYAVASLGGAQEEDVRVSGAIDRREGDYRVRESWDDPVHAPKSQSSVAATRHAPPPAVDGTVSYPPACLSACLPLLCLPIHHFVGSTFLRVSLMYRRGLPSHTTAPKIPSSISTY